MTKILNFVDLVAWKEGHRLVIDVYILTREFPQREIYILVSQMQRCSISITSNIAEGFSRKGKKEKIQFYSIALGSLTELQNQLLVAKDLTYLSDAAYKKINDQSIFVHKLINGLIKSAQNRT